MFLNRKSFADAMGNHTRQVTAIATIELSPSFSVFGSKNDASGKSIIWGEVWGEVMGVEGWVEGRATCIRRQALKWRQ